MKAVDILLLIGIAAILLLALRKCRLNRKKGASCGGNCADCGRHCCK